MAIADMEDLKKSSEKEEKENKFISGADMKKGKRNKGGRPKKAKEEKATEVLIANVTIDEKKAIEAVAKKMGISVSALIKISLSKFI